MRRNNPDPLLLSSALFFGAAGAFGLWWYFRDSEDIPTFDIEPPPENTHSAKGKPVMVAQSSGSFPISADAQKKIVKFQSLAESNENYALLTTGREFSYGVMQANLDAGRISELLAHYQAKGGKYAKHFAEFANWEQKAELSESQSKRDKAFLAKMKGSKKFQNLLKAAGYDPVMQEAQREYFTVTYLHPAWSYCRRLGWRSPVSYLIMASFFVQYGPYGATRHANAARRSGGGELASMRRLVITLRSQSIRDLRRRGYSERIIAHNTKKLDTFLRLIAQNPELSGMISFMGKTF